MIQTDLKRVLSAWYKGTLSPRKPEDETGPLLADRWGGWTTSMGYWFSNHMADDLDPAGYNQAFSDGHVKWLGRGAFKGSPLNWIYRRGTSSSFYFWVE